ncbi:MAG: signal peptide peptidase SppA [Chitinophagales bacterium]
MKQFLKFVLATIVGLFLTFLLFILIGSAIVSTATDTEGAAVQPNSVLKAKFNTTLPEQGQPSAVNSFDPKSFIPKQQMGLNDVLSSIRIAKEDDNIKGMYLELSGTPNGLATTSEIREAIEDFKESGKFVLTYGETMTQKAYYLASIADQIYLNPAGVISLKGYHSESMFLKNMLDKWEIEPQIFYAGKYKSATEPLRRTNMSEPNRKQVETFLLAFQEDYLQKVATSRSMSPQKLEQIMNELLVRNAKDAKEQGIADELLYEDQVFDEIKKKLGLDEEDKINFVDLGDYANAGNLPKKKKLAKEKIAVVYAQGGIVSGEGSMEQIGSEKYAKIIRKIRKNEDVKAIVLRINSGGGSALASEIIWRELEMAKEQGIAVVASMGDVAASGGYYIPVAADTIVAHENTITGSIGVFGVLMNASGFFENTMGLTFDRVKTTQFSDFPTSPFLSRSLNDAEKAVFTQGIDEIYTNFKQRVADGRNTDTMTVETYAQGRVWTGKQALELGLVDVLGSFQDAIDIAADMAGLENYRLAEYPRQKDPIQAILDDFMQTRAQASIKEELGPFYRHYQQLKEFQNMEAIQMRIPFDFKVE